MKHKNRKSHGFTLIEMLGVIAIIAVLVAIIIPTVTSATARANAATDAANLRSVLGVANTILLVEEASPAAALAGAQSFECKTFTGAEAYIAYISPGFIEPYFKSGENYYGLKYFSDIAETGSTAETAVSAPEGTLYKVGGDEVGGED